MMLTTSFIFLIIANLFALRVEVFLMMIRRQRLRILVRNRYRILLMKMLLQITQIMIISQIKNPYSANIVIGLAMISQTVLIFTHADFVGRQITLQ
jgi:hypothetical protein